MSNDELKKLIESCDGENELCRACSGSGEGYYTTNDKCTACDGSGIVVEKEGAE